jgi:hypothetical protein
MAETGDTGSGGEVTFVGGRATEQTTEGETHEGTDRGDELEAAKAAVKKALAEDAKEEGKKAAAEAKTARAKDPLIPRDRDANGQFVQDDPVGAEKEAAVAALKKEADADASALRKALADRKESAKAKAEASAEVEKMRQETRQFYAQLQREKAEVAAERQRIQMLRKDPVRAIRENGWDPESFIMDLAQDGTPEGAKARADRELRDSIAELREWKATQARQAQEQAQAHQETEKRQFRQNVEREFLNAANKHEALVSLYKGHEVGLIAEADTVAEQYRNVTGKEATFDEIAEYLAERTERWYKKRSGAGAPTTEAKAASVSSGKPTPGSATGKRSLSPAGSSERRSLGNSFADLDGDERRETAMAAVRAAIHASGER